ncbi:hypothetical protein N2152v2_004838 [Parachlorella kessleri]
MCVTFFLVNCLDDFPLVLAFNRDEAYERSTQSAHWWPDKPHILGGRDALAGGTWLCVSDRGRVAWLTNHWEKGPLGVRADGPSRGELPLNFVEGTAGPLKYLSQLEGHRYPGFNLLVADLQSGQAGYYSNRCESPGAQLVAPGLHGLSNGRLDQSWAKVEAGKRALQQLVDRGSFKGGRLPWDEIFGVMSDDRNVMDDPEALPSKRGLAAELDFPAARVFVPASPYVTPWGTSGTRSQTVVAVRRDGQCELRERYRSPEGDWREVAHRFTALLGPGGKGGAAGGGAAASAGPEEVGGAGGGAQGTPAGAACRSAVGAAGGAATVEVAIDAAAGGEAVP